MRGKIGDKQRLQHMLEAISEVETYVKGATLDVLNDNSMMLFACVKQIEIIGEASNHITQDTKEKIDGLDWKKIIGLRHILVYEYFGIDVAIIWYIIQNDLPELKSKVSDVIDTL